MKKMNLDQIMTITFILLVLGLITSQLLFVHSVNEKLELFARAAKLDMALKTLEGKEINGFYSGDRFYCVGTEDKDWEDIRMTDYHEMCHAFVAMDKAHFCNHTNQINYDIENYMDGGVKK